MNRAAAQQAGDTRSHFPRPRKQDQPAGYVTCAAQCRGARGNVDCAEVAATTTWGTESTQTRRGAEADTIRVQSAAASTSGAACARIRHGANACRSASGSQDRSQLPADDGSPRTEPRDGGVRSACAYGRATPQRYSWSCLLLSHGSALVKLAGR